METVEQIENSKRNETDKQVLLMLKMIEKYFETDAYIELIDRLNQLSPSYDPFKPGAEEITEATIHESGLYSGIITLLMDLSVTWTMLECSIEHAINDNSSIFFQPETK